VKPKVVFVAEELAKGQEDLGSESLKAAVRDGLASKENKDRHAVGATAADTKDPFEDPSKIEYTLVHDYRVLALFEVATYDAWIAQYKDNSAARSFVLSIQYSLDNVGMMEVLSTKLNNASSQAKAAFYEVYRQMVQKLTWLSWTGASGYVSA
jgi:hypothetical protein